MTVEKYLDERIEKIANKYSYDNDLKNALKRCVPAMLKDKTLFDMEILLKTLDRTEIFTFEKYPTREQVDEIKQKKFGNRNKHIKGEDLLHEIYGTSVPRGSHTVEPIFDDNMEIIDMVDFIYFTKLEPSSEIAEFYGTTIDYAVLIHELGHAWNANINGYIQEKNGDFTLNLRARRIRVKVDKENKFYKTLSDDNIFVEEALNSLEEENAICEMLNIKSVAEIPHYSPSQYQESFMPNVMREYVSVIGSKPFEDFRMLKRAEGLECYDKILSQTPSMNKIHSKEYIENKRKILSKVRELENVPEENIQEIVNFFLKHQKLYFSQNPEFNFIQNLNNSFEQLYMINVTVLKGLFGVYEFEKGTTKAIQNDNNNNIYNIVNQFPLAESIFPLRDARKEIEKLNLQKKKDSKTSFLEK